MAARMPWIASSPPVPRIDAPKICFVEGSARTFMKPRISSFSTARPTPVIGRVATEVRRLMRSLAHGRSYVCYSRPGSHDKMGDDFDATGHLSRSVFDEIGIPPGADVYCCGPTRFMADMKEALAALDVAPERIHFEIFNGSESMTPGVVGPRARAPHPP